MLALLIGLAVPVLGSLALSALLPEWRWDDVPFHATIEAAGGLIAFALAGVLLASRQGRTNREHHLWMSAGLVGMGILDVAHAAVAPGETFVWFHSTATMVGGVLMALVWLPSQISASLRARSALLPTGLAVLTLCAFPLCFPRVVPAMIDQGAFTLAARGLNILGGLGFMAAAWWLLVRYRAGREWDDYLLACLCALFGSAGILFELSCLWDAGWWWWHLLRLTGYALALCYSAAAYHRTHRQLRHEIGERKQAERSLRRLAVIAEQAAEGIAVADLDGNLEFVNAAWANMHGYETNEDLVGKHLNIFHTDEQMRADVIPFNEQVMRSGIHRGEVGHVRRDGTAFPTEMTVSLLREDGDQPLGLIGFATDIADRKLSMGAGRP